MQLTLPQLDFTVSLNACYDQIMHKMQVLTNMQIQLLRKFQHQLSNSQMHYEMIHDVRVMIVNLEQVYKDVKQYFNQMGIQFVYDFFRKIQVLMVCGYNFLSQALLASVDKFQDKKGKQTGKQTFLQCKVCKCTCPQNLKHKKRQIREVQQYDYKISVLQNQQQKLASQIQSIYEKMMMQKAMIQRTKPSLAIRQLQDMKEHIQNVMQSTNSIFQQTYMMKYVQFKNYLTQIKKPEDMVDYFISNMNFNMKEKFLKAMQKAIYKAQHMEEKLERKHLKDVQIQTQKIKQSVNSTSNNDRQSLNYRGFSSLKPQKNQNLLTKQRKQNQKIATQIQFLRKQLNSLMSQNQKMKKQVEKKQAERLQFKLDYDTLQNLYSKRSFQLETVQNQNRWLSTQKQSQSKKLRNQIKQLKKQQVQTSNQYTQTFIPPNYQNQSTQTQIIYFQNQIDNQIINVLKKNNDKMILKLNQKQRKIIQLKAGKDDTEKYKQCKILCLGFLEDLREVTRYKMKQSNRQNQKRKKSAELASRQPIIPLNENTSNQSVVVTINKLSEDIKTLLLSSGTNNKKPIHHSQQRRSSTSQKSKTFKLSSSKYENDKESQKSQQNSIKNVQGFFKNTKRNSTISLNRQINTIHKQASTFTKKSIYRRQYQERSSKGSQVSSNSLNSVDKEQKQQSAKRRENKLRRMSRSSSQKRQNHQHEHNKAFGLFKRKSSHQSGNQSSRQNFNIHKQKRHTSNTKKDNLQNNVSFNKQTNRKKLRLIYSQFSIQTQLTSIDIQNMQQSLLNYQHMMVSNSLDNLHSSGNKKDNFQSYLTRKHPYIKKPGGSRLNTTSRVNQSDRDYISVNNTLPMNDTQISELIKQNINRSKDEFSPHNLNFPQLNLNYSHLHPGRQSNITLESRLSTLVNPKSNRVSSNTGLIVFKKSNQNYQKRSSQMVFDGINLQKNTPIKQFQKRNNSFNTYRNDSLLMSKQKKESHLKNMINKMEDMNDSMKQNMNPIRQTIPMKSIFVQKIIQEQQNCRSGTASGYETLIQVSKKTPIQRQRMSPQRLSRQPPQTVFNRTVKQMILTSMTKQSLIQKIGQIYENMQKQRQKKKIRKIIKNTYTPRSSNQKRQQKRKQNSQIFKLGDLY